MPVEQCKIFKDNERCENYITQVFCRVSCGLCIPGKGKIFQSDASFFYLECFIHQLNQHSTTFPHIRKIYESIKYRYKIANN